MHIIVDNNDIMPMVKKYMIVKYKGYRSYGEAALIQRGQIAKKMLYQRAVRSI